MQPSSLYSEAERRCEELTQMCDILEKRISRAPLGSIHVVHRKGTSQFYLRTDAKDKSGKYISKKESKTIARYLQKKYDSDVLRLLGTEKYQLEKFLKRTSQFAKQSNHQKSNKCELLNNIQYRTQNRSGNRYRIPNKSGIQNVIRDIYSQYLPEIKAYVQPVDVSDEEFVKEWLGRPYEKKKIAENAPVFITSNGEAVRSKSELNIANYLAREGIPYKYECPFQLRDGGVIHPDFTVLDVKRRREIYWEHRGMMDDREYARHAVQRVKLFGREGVRLGETLILTEETSTCPLGTDEIEAVIESCFF